MKKFSAIFLGILWGLFITLILIPIGQSLFAQLFSLNYSLSFEGIKLWMNLKDFSADSNWKYIVLLSLPFLFAILSSEASFTVLSKAKNDHIKSFFLIVIIMMIGFVVVEMLVTVISIFAPMIVQTNWSEFFSQSDFSRGQQLILILMILFLFFAYVNLLSKRLKKNVSSIHQIKNKK